MPTIRTRTNADGSIAYHVQVRLKGHPTQTATFTRLTDARRWAQRTESDIREGRHFPGTAAKRRTLAETIARYRKAVLPHKRKNTIISQTKQLAWWAEQIGHLQLSDVTPPIIAELRDQLGQTFKAGTVNRYLTALSHVFTAAVREWEWADSNPVQRVNRQAEPKLRIRFLSDDERQRLLNACEVSNYEDLYTIVVLALSTGARKMELLTLRWDDVDLRRGTITIHDSKNKERRALPITGLALNLMRQHAKVRRIDTDFVFPRADGQGPASIEQPWKVARRRAQIDDFRFHDLSYVGLSRKIVLPANWGCPMRRSTGLRTNVKTYPSALLRNSVAT